MTEYQLKIVFVLVLCAPVAYFGVRFFITLVNSAIAGKRMPSKKGRASGNEEIPSAGTKAPAGRGQLKNNKKTSGHRVDRQEWRR